MNKTKIDKLYEQAHVGNAFNQYRFARLVVQECASIVEAQKESLCEDDSDWSDYDFGYHDAVIDANNMIKKHFGVEQ